MKLNILISKERQTFFVQEIKAICGLEHDAFRLFHFFGANALQTVTASLGFVQRVEVVWEVFTGSSFNLVVRRIIPQSMCKWLKRRSFF